MVDVAAMLGELGLAFAYDHFAQGESPEPPFVCFYFPEAENFAADNVVYASFAVCHLELYTARKCRELERRLERLLEERELVWDRSETWIESERLYEVLYRVTV